MGPTNSPDYEYPNAFFFTIYSKSGCTFCTKAKNELNQNELTYNIIDCDDYLIEDRSGFLQWMETLTHEPVKTFPIIFYKGIYIGGYDKLLIEIEKINSFKNISFGV
jgi:glutaredoxin